MVRFLIDRYIMFKWRRKAVNIDSFSDDIEEINYFSNNGITKITFNFNNFADYLNQNYIVPLLKNKKTNIITYDASPIDKSKGLTLSRYLSLNDPKIINFITSQKISNIIYSYLGRHFFLRNNPTVNQIVAKKDNWGTSIIHNDRFHQISLMLLLENITEADTHMEYLAKTHKLNIFDDLHPYPNSSQIKEKIKKTDKRIKLIGKKGTVFLFDSIGLHRTVLKKNTSRTIFHLNFTAGHNLYPFLDEKIKVDGIKYKNINIVKRQEGETYYVENYPKENSFRYLRKLLNHRIG
jgi:hypothetical protein